MKKQKKRHSNNKTRDLSAGNEKTQTLRISIFMSFLSIINAYCLQYESELARVIRDYREINEISALNWNGDLSVEPPRAPAFS